jgi:hypothetical protein
LLGTTRGPGTPGAFFYVGGIGVGFERKAMRKRRVASITTDFAAQRSVANGTWRRLAAMHQFGRFRSEADIAA